MSASDYTAMITPPSLAYMLLTPAVLMMMIFLNFAIFSIFSFTAFALSGQLQCAIARTRFSQSFVFDDHILHHTLKCFVHTARLI